MYRLIAIRNIEGDPRVRILRQMFNEGSIDLHRFARRLREIKESYDV